MRFSTVAAAAAFAAGVNAYGNSTGPVYTTEIVTAYTTYCPAPTQITHGGKTYTVTKATTLTITDCPCTVTKPVNPPKETPAPPKETPGVPQPPKEPPKGTPVVPAPPAGPTGGPAPAPNGTVPTVPAPPAGTGAPTAPGAPTFTGAANRAMAAPGAGLAAVFGLAAYVL